MGLGVFSRDGRHSEGRAFVVFVAVLTAVLLGGIGASPAAAKKPAKVSVKVLTKNQAALLKAKSLRVRVRSTGRTTVRLAAFQGNNGRLFKKRNLRFKRKATRVVRLGFTAPGRARLARCGAQAVRVVARYKRGKKNARSGNAKRLARDARRCQAPPPPPPPGPNLPNPATVAGCDPIDPAACMAPFPNDYFAKADSGTDTGLRLDFKAENMPKNDKGDSSYNDAYNRNDGFSPNNVMITKIPGLDTPAVFRENKLVSQMNIGAYADADQRVMLIDTTNNQRVPIWAELDMVPGTPNPHDGNKVQGNPEDRVLMIHPAVSLDYGKRYVVALRDMTVNGQSVPPNNVFAMVRDGVETANPQIEERREQMKKVFSVTDAAGIERSTLNIAWDFTVASKRNLTERALTMRKHAFDQLGDTNLADGKIAGDSPEINDVQATNLNVCPGPSTACGGGQSRYAFRKVTGTITVPCYMDGATTKYNLGATGTPCESGSRMNYAPGTDLPAQKVIAGTPVTWEAPFTCIIPRTGENQPAMQTDARGAIVFGHGLMQSNATTETLGMYPAALEGVACGTDWTGLSQLDLLQHLVTMINLIIGGSDLSIFDSLPDRTQQGYINTLYLARALAHEDGFASLPEFQDGGGNPVFEVDQDDTGKDLGYYGVSLGGINGGATTALAPDWERATLAVPGMGFSTLLTRSTQFNQFLPTVYAAYQDGVERSIGMSMIQVLWDRGEPSAYSKHILDGGLGTPQHEVIIHEAFGDHQVANIQTQTLARTVGAKIKAPILADGRIDDLSDYGGGGGDYLFTAPDDVDPYWDIPVAQSSEFNVSGGLPDTKAVMMSTDTGPIVTAGSSVRGTKANPDWNIAPVSGNASNFRDGYDPHQPGATSPALQQMIMPFLLGQGLYDPCGNGAPDIYGQPPFTVPFSSANPVPCPAPPIDYIRNGR